MMDEVSEAAFVEITLRKCKGIAKAEKDVILRWGLHPIWILGLQVEEDKECSTISEEAVGLREGICGDSGDYCGQKNKQEAPRHVRRVLVLNIITLI